MISKTIEKMVGYIKKTAGTNVVFGRKDFAAAEYPIISVIHENVGAVAAFNEMYHALSIPITVSVIGLKGAGLRPYDLIEAVINALDLFESEEGKGHKISAAISPREEGDTIILSIEYTLRFILQKTTV